MQATVETAHNIARVVYQLLKYGEAYQEESAHVYEQKRRERELRQLIRRADKLGYTLRQASSNSITSAPLTIPDGEFLRMAMLGDVWVPSVL